MAKVKKVVIKPKFPKWVVSSVIALMLGSGVFHTRPYVS